MKLLVAFVAMMMLVGCSGCAHKPFLSDLKREDTPGCFSAGWHDREKKQTCVMTLNCRHTEDERICVDDDVLREHLERENREDDRLLKSF